MDMLKTKILSRLTVYVLGSVLFFMTPFNVNGQSKNKGSDLSLVRLKQMIAENPDSLSYHKKFIEKFKKRKGVTWSNQDSVLSLLQPQYKKWIQQFSHSAIVPFAIGDAFANAESPEAKSYLLEAVKRDPNLAKAWSDLSIDADRWGDKKAAREYMGKAEAAKPNNPDYAFYYAMKFEDTNPAKWRSMLYDLVKRFPESERGAQGLYWLGYDSKNTAEKFKVYKQLRKQYPPAKFRWSKSGMYGLYGIYLQKDAEKAAALAYSMGDGERWGKLDTLAQNLVKAHRLMSQNKYKEAGDILQKLNPPRYPDLGNIIALTRAKADDLAGNTREAYNSLVVIYAKEPTDGLNTAIRGYGNKLNKNEQQIKKDIWEVRKKSIKPAPSFDLGLYTSKGTLSLNDLKGKVVLLTFWFPGCGPCRGEFPHFQHVINKFQEKNVKYVGINVSPSQDQYVVPFMKGTGYTFIPLKGNSKWAQKKYGVRGEPTNFLVDQKGNIVFSHFRIDGSNERTLELMINSLLEREKNF